jgi:uncharacterized protein HemX
VSRYFAVLAVAMALGASGCGETQQEKEQKATSKYFQCKSHVGKECDQQNHEEEERKEHDDVRERQEEGLREQQESAERQREELTKSGR